MPVLLRVFEGVNVILSSLTIGGPRRTASERRVPVKGAGATFAAENAATVVQLKEVFGWSAAQIAMEYIKDAEQQKIASGAMHLVVGNVA